LPGPSWVISGVLEDYYLEPSVIVFRLRKNYQFPELAPHFFFNADTTLVVLLLLAGTEITEARQPVEFIDIKTWWVLVYQLSITISVPR
jgi:hypothetical protein